jgi:FtsP/CotA-like multicopper oxidase with cupredoxin domain
MVIAIDGQPCDPHEPDGGRILLGPAMRADLMLDMKGDPGRRYRVIDDFYKGLSYRLTQLAYSKRQPLHGHTLDAPLVLPRNPLSEPDLSEAEHHVLTLQGGMMGGGAMMGMGGMMGMSQGATWAINGMSMTGDGQAGMPPLLTLQSGSSCLLTLRNDTAWWHPMHLHGHSFRVLNRNGVSVPHRQWADTVLIRPKETVDIAFVADNPGDWMLHCHVTDHQVSGMMAVLRIA